LVLDMVCSTPTLPIHGTSIGPMRSKRAAQTRRAEKPKVGARQTLCYPPSPLHHVIHCAH
jgi:hypothetical protein